MSPTTIIDLDEVLGPPKKVRLGGKTYTLPPDLPVELYLKITGAAERGLEESEFIKDLYQDVLGLFRYGQPTLQELPLSLGQLVVAIGKIYGDGEPAPEERPTRPSRASGGRTSSRTPATKSRS